MREGTLKLKLSFHSGIWLLLMVRVFQVIVEAVGNDTVTYKSDFETKKHKIDMKVWTLKTNRRPLQDEPRLTEVLPGLSFRTDNSEGQIPVRHRLHLQHNVMSICK